MRYNKSGDAFCPETIVNALAPNGNMVTMPALYWPAAGDAIVVAMISFGRFAVVHKTSARALFPSSERVSRHVRTMLDLYAIERAFDLDFKERNLDRLFAPLMTIQLSFLGWMVDESNAVTLGQWLQHEREGVDKFDYSDEQNWEHAFQMSQKALAFEVGAFKPAPVVPVAGSGAAVLQELNSLAAIAELPAGERLQALDNIGHLSTATRQRIAALRAAGAFDEATAAAILADVQNPPAVDGIT